VAGIVTGVLVVVGLAVTAVLWCCAGCFGRKKKTTEGAEQVPPAYGMENKDLEPQVDEVAPGAK